MTVYDYTGSSVVATLTRDTNTGAVTFAQLSWVQGFAAPVLYESFLCDIRSAGDYELRIDGVTVASVAGVAAAATNVNFVLSTPLELLPGNYTFRLVCTSGAVTWYTRGNIPAPGVGVGGAGWDAQAWTACTEINTSNTVPGQHTFKIADQALTSLIAWDSTSSGSFTGQTWSLTWDQDVWLFGIIKRVFSTADTYTLSIDGNDEASVVKTNGSASEDLCLACDTNPLPVDAGARTFRIYPGGGSRRMVYDSGTGSAPSGSGSSHTTAWGNWVEGPGNKVPCRIWFMLPTPPDAPEDLAVDPDVTSLEFTWAAPSAGPTPTGYEVRIDAGAWVDVGNVLTHTFTPLDPETTYTLDVRAYNAAGPGPSESIEGTTDAPSTPVGYYRLVVTVGGEVLWDVTRGECAGDEDGPAFGVVLPFTFGWRTPDKDPLPVQPDTTMMTFRVLAPTADDASVAGLLPGETIQADMFVNDIDVDPWQTFTGVITTATGEFIPWGDGVAWLVTVQAADGTAALGGIVVGFGAVDDPWPLETVEDRLTRLQDEMDMTLNEGDALTTVTWYQVAPGGSGSGSLWGNLAGLPLRDASPVSVLSVVQQAFKDLAAQGEDDLSDPVYGRWVYLWDPVTYTLTLAVWWRYGLPAVTLDGCHVSTKATWTRVIGDVVYQWAIIDGVVYPFVATWQTPPYVANTAYVDAGFGTDEVQDNLAALILQDDWTQLEGWRTRRIRYEASADYTTPPPVAGWASTGLARYQGLTPVIITPLDGSMLVNGVDYLAGTLSGARVTIPPGGDYFLEIDLRPELPPNVELPE